MRPSMRAKLPDSSDARTMFTYSGLKTFGCLARASENGRPLSTSCLICSRIRRKRGLVVCSAMPEMALRMGMPALIITASWLVKLCTSCRLGPNSRRSLRRRATQSAGPAIGTTFSR